MKIYPRYRFLDILSGAFEKELTGSSTDDKSTLNVSSPYSPGLKISGLNPYSGQWGQTQVLHLLRRTLFGVTKSDYDYFSKLTLDESLDILLTPAPAPPPPLNAYNSDSYTDPDVPFGKTWVHCQRVDNHGGIVDRKRLDSISAWWTGLLINQGRSLTEKMTLFWHNHTPVAFDGTKDVRAFYTYIAPLRSNSLGNFKKLMYDITTCTGMMQYLDSVTSRAEAPNENYSRECQELFTAGKGPDSHYTQNDVVEGARLLTGWTNNQIGTDAVFVPQWHDSGDKRFSAFYNNTVIKGKPGAAGATEVKEWIDMIFNNKEVARHTCRCLYRWFVSSSIDSRIEAEVIHPLAELFAEKNYEIAPILRDLLRSEHFFDAANIGCQIKNPVDHYIGICRQFNLTSFPTDLTKQYQAWSLVSSKLFFMYMCPGWPPSVAGWSATYLYPGYDRIWINSDTIAARLSATDELFSTDGINNKEFGITLRPDVINFSSLCKEPSDAARLIADTAAFLSPVAFDEVQTSFMESILSPEPGGNHSWKEVWNLYTADPENPAAKDAVTTRLRNCYIYILQQCESQLI